MTNDIIVVGSNELGEHYRCRLRDLVKNYKDIEVVSMQDGETSKRLQEIVNSLFQSNQTLRPFLCKEFKLEIPKLEYELKEKLARPINDSIKPRNSRYLGNNYHKTCKRNYFQRKSNY